MPNYEKRSTIKIPQPLLESGTSRTFSWNNPLLDISCIAPVVWHHLSGMHLTYSDQPQY